MTTLLNSVQRALSAWDTTTLKTSGDGMLSEAMETLRAAFNDAMSTKASLPAAPAPVAPWPEFDASTDPMYDPAKAIVLEHRRASISLVQRHLRIGYNRAARLLERMEKEGLIGPLLADGGRQLLA